MTSATGRKALLLVVGLAGCGGSPAVKPRPGPTGLNAGQFWYTRVTEVRRTPLPIPRGPSTLPLHTGSLIPALVRVSQRATTERWVGLDGTVRTRVTTSGSPHFASAGDRARLRAAGLPLTAISPATDATTQGDAGFPSGQPLFSYRQLETLPTAPRALYKRIRAALARAQRTARREYTQAVGRLKAQPGTHTATFTISGSAAGATLQAVAGLLESPVPAPVRAALYRAALLAPGVRRVGTVSDGLGRSGAGIAAGPPAAAFELIVDPRTGALLGRHSRTAGDSTELAAAVVVSSIDAVPPGLAAIPEPPGLAHVDIRVNPTKGGPATTFAVSLAQPLTGGLYIFTLIGPVRPGCRPSGFPTLLPPLIAHGAAAGQVLTRPLAPATGGWCPGVHTVDVSLSASGHRESDLGSRRFTVR